MTTNREESEMMRKLLCIVGGMNAGGAETFLMKIYRKLDRNEFQIDFAVAVDGVYDEEIKKLGGNIYKITSKSNNIWKNFFDIIYIVKKYKYKSVLRVSQNSFSAFELLAAKIGGAKNLAFRSSNSSTVEGNKKEIIIHKMCKWMPALFANIRFAPSTEAAEHMFGKGCIESNKAFLLKNGIDINEYHYDEQARQRIRKELELNNAFVVGHIGRFNQQKNHIFLLEVFSKIKECNENALLVLCGTGEKEKEIKKLVYKMNLEKSVIFAGVRLDIPQVLSAMDVLIFPSLYEGMPNAIIEAQATGLPCVISDHITKEVKVTDIVKFMPLENPEEWAKVSIMAKGSGSLPRELYAREIIEHGYSIEDSCTLFCQKCFF